MSDTTNAAPLGRVKACNACRQLKLRCDAYENNKGTYSVCSRCRRMHRECVVSTTFKRKARQTKAELQRELEQLRAQRGIPTTPATPPHENDEAISSGRYSTDGGTVTSPGHASEMTGLRSPPSLPAAIEQNLTNWTSPLHGNSSYANRSATDSTSNLAGHGGLNRAVSSQADDTQTMPRALKDVSLSGWKIDGCFSIFFQYYYSTVAGLFDQAGTPNEIYESSPLLFWSVVYVGARRYSQDPTIVASLQEPLRELLRQSLFDPDHAITTIQAAVVLCLWPFPVDSAYKDQTHAIAGAAMQLAVQKGLPCAFRKQDFVRVALKRKAADELFRARIWCYCVITFQSIGLYDGLPCLLILDRAGAMQDQSLLCNMPPVVLYRYKLHRLQTDAISSIIRTVDLGSTVNSDLLNSFIEQFDTELQQVQPPDSSDIVRLTLHIARLFIRAFHFFSAPSSQRNLGILQTYFIACDLLSAASQLDKASDQGSHSTYSQARLEALAAICILRILRSPLRMQINAQLGEDLYFEVIRISKKRSIQNNDLDARVATILIQLWSSTRLFKFKDGSIDGLRLFLRGRLSMSVLFDTLWWWRAEFGGNSNPYLNSESGRASTTLTPVNSSLLPTGEMAAPVTSDQKPGDNPEFSDPNNATIIPDLLGGSLNLFNWQLGDGFDLDWQGAFATTG